MNDEVQDFMDRHADAIAGVLEAQAREALKHELRQALARNRDAGLRGRWQAEAEIEHIRQLVIKTGIPVVMAVQR